MLMDLVFVPAKQELPIGHEDHQRRTHQEIYPPFGGEQEVL